VKLTKIPMYVISTHSAICKSYATCGTPISRKEKGFPVFKIPKNTFIISMATAGETCRFGNFGLLARKVDEIQKWLITTDKTDAISYFPGDSYVGLSSLYRATDTLYPNVSCTFQSEPGVPNDLGVFDLHKTKDFVHRNSIIQQSDKSPHPEEPTGSRQSWYLDELIQKVYEKTGIAKGVFIFAGCMSELHSTNLDSAESLDFAEQLIRTADLTYTSRVPTVDVNLVSKPLRPINLYMRPLNSEHPHFLEPTALAMASAAHTLGTELRTLFPNAKRFDEKEYNDAKALLLALRKRAK